MNLLHLYYFYVVAKEQGFRNASRRLRVQQPAISRMVKQLENSLNIQLFERVGRRVRLTPQGVEVFARSQRIFAEVDELKTFTGQLAGIPRGPVAFGAAEAIASHLVPGAIAKSKKLYSDLYPLIYSGPASSLFDQIQSGELEFGLFFHIPTLPEKLKVETLRMIRFFLVVKNRERKNRAILESFIGSREIDDSSVRAFPTLEKLQRHHPQAQITISSNNLTAHRSMVLRGLGVSVLPEFLVAEDLKAGRLVDVLPKEHLIFPLKLVHRKTATLGLNAQTILASL